MVYKMLEPTNRTPAPGSLVPRAEQVRADGVLPLHERDDDERERVGQVEALAVAGAVQALARAQAHGGERQRQGHQAAAGAGDSGTRKQAPQIKTNAANSWKFEKNELEVRP